MSEQQELGIEITYRRKYNLGNWNDKEYTVKLSGNKSMVEEELKNQNEALKSFIDGLEDVVERANVTNMQKNNLDPASGKTA